VYELVTINTDRINARFNYKTPSFIPRAGRKKIRGLILGSDKKFLHSPQYVDGLLWDQQIPTSFINLSFY